MGAERKEDGERVGSREIEYEGMQPMPPSLSGRARRRGLDSVSMMKRPEG